VAKFSEDKESLANEIRILQRLQKTYSRMYPKDKKLSVGIPELITYGMVTLPYKKEGSTSSIQTNETSSQVDGQQLCYFIMERYDITLEQHIQKLTKQKRKLEPSECLDIVIQLVSIFEIIHKSKRTYNDLKLANIMINSDTL